MQWRVYNDHTSGGCKIRCVAGQRGKSSTFLLPQHTDGGQEKSATSLLLSVKCHVLCSQVWSHQGRAAKCQELQPNKSFVSTLKGRRVIVDPVNYILMKLMQFFASVMIFVSEIWRSTGTSSTVHPYSPLKGFVNCILLLFHMHLSASASGQPTVMATAVVRSRLICNSFVRRLNVILNSGSAFSTVESNLTFSFRNTCTKEAEA